MTAAQVKRKDEYVPPWTSFFLTVFGVQNLHGLVQVLFFALNIHYHQSQRRAHRNYNPRWGTTYWVDWAVGLDDDAAGEVDRGTAARPWAEARDGWG
jgi:hypothetical protein